ncbi:MAG: hypothetical protein HZA46_06745 [Planctomycetales bacterium]|nr:hypothetical protein [Planctomycetales bacterium]
MNSKSITVGLVAFALGFLSHLIVPRSDSATSGEPLSVQHHWKLVNDYVAFTRDPKSFMRDVQAGLYGATPPYAIEPSLAVLVSAGELEHVDIVLPLVPQNEETNQYWMHFVGERQDILHATANPVYADYRPSGDPPLHFNLWFKARAKADVQQLIKELEDLATKGR